MIEQILGVINILEKVGGFVGWVRKDRTSMPESISARFIRLFECHDVHRNQIPRFFGHGLTVVDVQNDAALLEKLDESVLDAACALFGVRREWLDGAEAQAYPFYDFYKHPEYVAPFLRDLQSKNPGGGLCGVLLTPHEKKGEALVVLYEAIGTIGEKTIYRHHLCNNWQLDYWKSRAYLTAFVAVAWRLGVYIRGHRWDTKQLIDVVEGERLIDRAQAFSGGLWHPEEMALVPGKYLSGVDPERDNFGMKAALKLWLSLEEEGYLATGIASYSKAEIRKTFEQTLNEYS